MLTLLDCNFFICDGNCRLSRLLPIRILHNGNSISLKCFALSSMTPKKCSNFYDREKMSSLFDLYFVSYFFMFLTASMYCGAVLRIAFLLFLLLLFLDFYPKKRLRDFCCGDVTSDRFISNVKKGVEPNFARIIGGGASNCKKGRSLILRVP